MVYKSRGCFPEVYRVSGEVWSGLCLCASLFCLALSSFIFWPCSHADFCQVLKWLQQLQVSQKHTMLSRTREGFPFLPQTSNRSPTHSLRGPITRRTRLHLWLFLPVSGAGGWANNTEHGCHLIGKEWKGEEELWAARVSQATACERRGTVTQGPYTLTLCRNLIFILLLLALGPTRVWKITIYKAVICSLVQPNIRKDPADDTSFHFTRIREGLFHNGKWGANT